MPTRNAISLKPAPATIGKETLENAAKIKVIVYPWRSDLRNLFFIVLWKPIMDRRIAAGRNEKNIRYSPRVRSGLPQPGEYFSRKIPVIPRSIKKSRRTILIFLGKNLILMTFFHIAILVIFQLFLNNNWLRVTLSRYLMRFMRQLLLFNKCILLPEGSIEFWKFICSMHHLVI